MTAQSSLPPKEAVGVEPAVSPALLTAEDLDALLRHLANARSRIEENTQTAAAIRRRRIEEVDAWLDAETKGDRAEVERLTALAEGALREAQRLNPELTRLTVPAGRVTSTRRGAEAVPLETAVGQLELQKWAREHGWLRTTTVEKVAWAEIKKAGRIVGEFFALGDEVVPGVVVKPASRTYGVEI